MHDAFEAIDERSGIREWRHRGNGLRALLLPDRTVPAATFMVTYLVGSRDEPTGLTGATHFLEHLMFKGTERFGKHRGTSVFQVLQRLGAQVNATTWLDRTNYYALLPAEHLERAVEIEADRMRGLVLHPDAVESERTVILNELDRGENEPVRRLHHAVWSQAFTVHPYRHPTIGWRSDVEAVTADDLRGFYDEYYWPDNAVVSMVGDFDPGPALELLHRHFGAIPAAPVPVRGRRVVEPPQPGPRRVTVRMQGEPGAVILAWKSPAGLDRRTDALSLLAMILSRGKHARLYKALIDSGLALNQSAYAGRFRDPGLFQVVTMPAPGRAHEAVEAAVREALDLVARQGVSEAERARALRQLEADEAYTRDGPFAVAGRLNEAVATGDWRLYVDWARRAASIGLDEIRDAAREVLTEAGETVGWFEPSVTVSA